MIISSLSLSKPTNTEGITLSSKFKNELNNLSNTVVITGGNGSGKSRFLKFLQKNFKLYIDGSNSAEVSFNVINDKDGPEEVLTSELAKSFSIINYSHFDAKLQTPDKFSPYVIHQAKSKLLHCNYEETALNSLLYLKDLCEGYSEESNETNNYKALYEFIDFAKELELDFSWDTEEKRLKIFNRNLDDAKLSPGQLYALRIAVACKAHEPGENYIFLLDEPETHLHPSLLIKVVNKLLEHFDGAQFWIATHSLSLISYLSVTRDDASVLYMEKGCISGRLQSNSEPILNNLVGTEDNQFAIKQLFVSPEEMACNKFCAECFLKPEVSNTVKSNDPSTLMVENDIKSSDESEQLNILDYGAGEARLLLCMHEDNLKNGYRYNTYNIEEKYSKICKNVLETLKNDGKSYLNKDSLVELYGQIDRVYMVNVLHEIDPQDWKDEFGIIAKLLKDDGKLVIVERETLTIGESPFSNGYLMLTGIGDRSSAAELLFDPRNTKLIRHNNKNYVIAHEVTKKGVENVQNVNLAEVFSALEKDALLMIKKLKSNRNQNSPIEKYKFGLELSFWLNQMSCSILCRDEINQNETHCK